MVLMYCKMSSYVQKRQPTRTDAAPGVEQPPWTLVWVMREWLDASVFYCVLPMGISLEISLMPFLGAWVHYTSSAACHFNPRWSKLFESRVVFAILIYKWMSATASLYIKKCWPLPILHHNATYRLGIA